MSRASVARGMTSIETSDARDGHGEPSVEADDGPDERYVTYDAIEEASEVPAAEFRLTCPDKTGLGADICRTVFEFGLVVTRGDFTTDGVWALVLLTLRAGNPKSYRAREITGRMEEEEEAEEERGGGARGRGAWGAAAKVLRGAVMRLASWGRERASGAPTRSNTPRLDRGGGARSDGSAMSSSKLFRFDVDASEHGGGAALAEMENIQRTAVVDWELLRQRLELLCPLKSALSTIPSVDSFERLEQMHTQQSLYILQVEGHDRVGLLHDVTLALWELQLSLHRAHVTTSPSGKAVDLFYVTDDLHELPNPARVGDISRKLKPVVASTPDDISRVNILVHPAPSFVTRQGRIKTLRTAEGLIVTAARPPPFDFVTMVEVDNLMSPAHTVFQIRTRDRQGLLYDCLRVSKDLKVSVSYAKVEIVDKAVCEIALFTRKNKDQAQTDYLCAKYKEHVDRPLKVEMLCESDDGGGLTSELRVVAPLDIVGHTRPRVLLDVTEALQDLNVMVFKADIVTTPRTEGSTLQEEVHRFLLTDLNGDPISTPEARQQVCDRVNAALLR